METLGVLLLAVGAIVGFGARRIVMGRFRPDQEDADAEDVKMLMDSAVMLVKIVGLGIVTLGVVFIMILS